MIQWEWTLIALNIGVAFGWFLRMYVEKTGRLPEWME